jgi:hypothetical protein
VPQYGPFGIIRQENRFLASEDIYNANLLWSFIQLPILVALTTLICRLHFKHTALASLLRAVVIALAEKVFNFLTSFTGICLFNNLLFGGDI